MTSTLSILNRVTGIALGFGALLLTWWLLALLGEPSDFDAVQEFLGSVIGRLLLLGWVWALWFHLANGIRHLVWDTAHGLELPSVYRSGWTVIILSVVLTAVTWVAGSWFV